LTAPTRINTVVRTFRPLLHVWLSGIFPFLIYDRETGIAHESASTYFQCGSLLSNSAIVKSKGWLTDWKSGTSEICNRSRNKTFAIGTSGKTSGLSKTFRHSSDRTSAFRHCPGWTRRFSHWPYGTNIFHHRSLSNMTSVRGVRCATADPDMLNHSGYSWIQMCDTRRVVSLVYGGWFSYLDHVLRNKDCSKNWKVTYRPRILCSYLMLSHRCK